MHSILSFAVAGASLLSAANAAPYGGPSASSAGYLTTTYTTSGSAPTNINFLNDGFPNPSSQQLQIIEDLAHGTLPNGPPPPSLSTQGGINFQFLQFNEEFETVFFSSLLHNLTTNVPGYKLEDADQQKLVIEIITAVLAQEQLHALNARKADQAFGRTVIEPCPNYSFGVDNFEDAIALAAKFTDVVLGTLQDLILIFAQNNDDGATAAVASVVGQEGEQEGFYRLLQNKGLIPNALPFLTRSTRDFAFSAINQDFVVGSCDGSKFLTFTVNKHITNSTSQPQFSSMKALRSLASSTS
jgi:hypothetical protein